MFLLSDFCAADAELGASVPSNLPADRQARSDSTSAGAQCEGVGPVSWDPLSPVVLPADVRGEARADRPPDGAGAPPREE